MLQTLMRGEISFLSEAHIALLTSVRFVGRMSAFVSRKMILHAESFAENVATVLLLARVNRQMSEQLLPPSE